MKKFSLSVVAGLLTFSIGVIVALVWMTRNTPELINETKPKDWCLPLATQSSGSLKIGANGYFPKAAFFRDEHRDQLVRSLYTKYLTAMDEPSLLDSRTNNDEGTYRFTWLRSFHSKVVVRISTAADVRLLTVKELGLEKPVRRGVSYTRPLNEDEWTTFARQFDSACVWNLPSTQGEAIANDGAWWVFEANSAGHYQVIATQVPEDSFRELCLHMLKLSGLPLDDGEIY